MKTKFSKRILSLFLAVMMVVTSIPMFALTASAADSKYLFAYFTGNSEYGQRINFALSTDGVNFNPLNGNQPILKNEVGLSKGVRDPYIFKGNDNVYYMLATDGDYSTGDWGYAQYSMIVYKSTDLCQWEQTLINFNTVLSNNGISGSITRAWAPQAIYDSSVGKYMVYLSLNIEGSSVDEYNNNKYVLYYFYTSDLFDQSKYEAPHVLYNPGYTVIDGDIAFNPADNLYYLYFKDERDNSTSAPNGKRILYTTSATLNGGYSNNATRFNRDNKGQEGCNSYFVGDDLYMIVDYYGDGQFYIFKSTGATNFKSFTKVGNINNCSARHGSIISITDEQYNALANYDFLKINENSNAIYTWSKENFVISGHDWKGDIDDGSGHTYDLAIEGNEVGVGTNGYVKVGSGEVTVYAGNININDGNVRGIVQREDFSVRFSHRRNGNTLGNQNIAADGTVFNIAKANTTEYYLRVSESGQLTVNVNGEYKTAQSSVSIPVNQYQDFLIKYDGQKTELYIDGMKAAVVEGTMTARPGDCFTALGFCDAIKSGSNIVRGHASFKNLAFYGSTDWFKISTDKVSEFESKVKSISTDKIYTNIGNAYNAYVLYNKAKDSYYYGQNTDVDMGYYQYNLDREVASMKLITNGIVSVDNTKSVPWNSGSITDSTYYSNVLWANSSISANSIANANTMDSRILANSTIVLLNDGNKIKYPVAFMIKNGWGASKSNLKCIIASSTNFNVEQDWVSGTQVHPDNYEWNTTGSSKVSISTSSSSTFTLAYNNAVGDNVRYYFFRNYMTRGNSENTSTYYDLDNSLSYTAYNKNNKTVGSSIGNNVYTINYLTLKNLLNSKYTTDVKNAVINVAKDISQYKEGGAAGILAIADCLVDPTAYDYSSNTASVVQEVAGQLKAKTEKLQGLSVTTTATTDSTNYKNLRNALDNATIDYSAYTTDSTDQYDAIVTAARSLMADVLDNGYVHGSWVGADATALNSKNSILNPILDKTEYNSQMTAKDKSLFTDSVQNYTFDSWKAVRDAINNLAPYKDRDGKYDKSTSTSTYYFSGGSKTYYPYVPSTDCTNTFNGLVDALKALEFDACGDTQNFDAANTVVSNIDRAMYTDSALSAFDKAVEKAVAGVYHTVTDSEASTYGLNAGDNVILTGQSATDELTKKLLEAVNTLNSNKDANVNKYSAVIKNESGVQQGDPIVEYYGDSFKYTISETVAKDSIVTWAVTVYANDTDMNNALAGDPKVQPVNSQVVSTYNGTTIERTANGSMCIQYFIEEGSKTGSTTYKVYNAYGNVIAVEYKTEALDKDYFKANYADPVLPFYTFKEWSVSAADNGVVKVKPVFEGIPTKTVTVDTNYATISFNKMSGGKAVVGATATITGNKENIYGWAVATGGKYQIVGYGKDYKFNVFADESYVPIIKTESGYQINGTNLIADMVAGFSNNSNGNLSDNAYLAAKLDAKAPFVYVQDKLVKYKDGKTNKVKFYIRVTAGTEADNLAYGIVVDGKKIASTAKNEGGQFYMATKEDNYNNNITKIDAYASYTFQYTFKDSNDVTTVATIATADYAKVK